MANVTVLNTSSDLSSKTLISAENPYTITGLLTFDRDPSAPFAVSANSAVVTNLDADKLDGEEGSAYHAAANLTGSIADARLSANVPLLNVANTFTASQVIDSSSNAFLYLDRGTTAHWGMVGFKTAGNDKYFIGLDDDGGDNLVITGSALTPFVTMNSSGVMTFSSIGTHSFTGGANSTQLLDIINTTSGTGAAAVIRGQAGSNYGGLYVQSQGYTTAAPFSQSGVTVYANGSGGLNLSAADASGVIRFYTGGTTERIKIDTNGQFDFSAGDTPTAPTASTRAGFVASGTYFAGAVSGTTMGLPSRWLTVTANGGTTYKIPMYAE